MHEFDNQPHETRCACCEHEHEHEQDTKKDQPPLACGCGCGHCGNEEEKNPNIFKIEMISSLLFFSAGFLSEHIFQTPPLITAILFGVSIILSGWRVFRSGWRSLLKLRMDETTLMAVAVIAAFGLGQFLEAAMVAVLYQLGEMIEDKAVDSSRDSIEKLAEIRADTARRVLDGTEEIVSAESVQIGDTIRVYPFERIPLDGIVLSGNSTLNTSALTGESAPADAFAGSEVLSGMMNEQGPLTIEVTHDLQNSAASRIIAMVESAAARKGKAEKLITRFAEIYTPLVMALALLLMVLPPLFGLGEFRVWLYRALVFLVASCPCALVISVPLGFYAGIGAESKNGVLIKGGRFLEALALTDAVVFDKTGTLTSGELKLNKVTTLGSLPQADLLRIAASAEQYSTHPAAKAVIKAAAGIELLPTDQAEEIPGHGVVAVIDGKKVVCGRRHLLEQNGLNMESYAPASIFVAIDGVVEGSMELNDTAKPDAAEGVKMLKEIGIKRVVMLTGDNENSAAAAAQECGITEYHAGLLPESKVSLMESIRNETGKTIFVGDGINDAPVLAASDCGVAMGLGTDAAIEASDVVLTLDKPSKLAPAIRIARRAMGIIRFNIFFALAFKALVLVLAALGYSPMWMAVFADVGVCILTVLNATRILKFR
ncbi:heavy metal translocating P-type ATPase [Caproiciproducens faecalis]|uniref:Cd(2+)-exporting ATPase n=1 Tax=Caproiciproducens faecalis TaxID=2820301 RepID=A0ABS7DKD8_9FIRM|nr:heavy metal translocating P-type ATPase [Caproiciproducens faecalis]MBW7571566.1 cadmium-translocating P-type ATPase [Caproiciproducens faecalis]